MVAPRIGVITSIGREHLEFFGDLAGVIQEEGWLAELLPPASQGGVPETVVFDEVDAGIGGRAAEAVGERLARLSAAAQVLCVTHLPQIASRASCHWRVWKQQGGGRTLVRADRLDAGGRIEEIARMLAGRTVTDAARRHAAEMIALAAGSDTSSGIRRRKGTRRSA
jgi:hypothetical protein